jgi:hypothetical protein
MKLSEYDKIEKKTVQSKIMEGGISTKTSEEIKRLGQGEDLRFKETDKSRREISNSILQMRQTFQIKNKLNFLEKSTSNQHKVESLKYIQFENIPPNTLSEFSTSITAGGLMKDWNEK